MFVECMICLVRILDETVSDIYNVDVGLLATVNNAFAEEEKHGFRNPLEIVM